MEINGEHVKNKVPAFPITFQALRMNDKLSCKESMEWNPASVHLPCGLSADVTILGHQQQ